MLTVETHAGRLCEIRADANVRRADMTGFRARLATAFQSIPSRVVICSDLTQCAQLDRGVTDALIAVARIDNPKIERHAMLVRSGDVIGVQLDAVARASGSDARRVFVSVPPARAWLCETLTDVETAQLDRFLSSLEPRVP